MFGLTVCIVVDNGHVSQVFVQGRKLSTCYLHTQAVFPSLLHLLRKLSHSFLTLDSYQFVFCKHLFLSKMSEKLCLQWNDFQENIKSAIGNLREDKDLQDVTLVSEDGQQVEAHKVILAASSPFFQNILRKNSHPHPMIFMKGVKFEDLQAIVDFLYCGEANIFQENIDAFLAIAEELKLKGLTSKPDKIEENMNPNKVGTSSKPTFKTEKWISDQIQNNLASIEDQTTSELSQEGLMPVQSFVSSDVQELDAKVKSLMELSENRASNGRQPYVRKVCGKEGQWVAIRDHIESNHLEGVSLPCSMCEKTYRSRTTLRRHNNSCWSS